MEPILDTFSNGKSIQIDRLELDLGVVSFDTRQWENALVDALRDALHKSIQEWLTTAPPDRVQSLPESLFTQWLYYLKTGRLNWSAGALPTDWQTDVLAVLSSRQGAIQELQQRLKANILVPLLSHYLVQDDNGIDTFPK